MRVFIHLAVFAAVICMAGCTHTHSVLTVDVDGKYERIKTKYRYNCSPCYLSWQPDVFGSDGIVIEIESPVETLKKHDNWTGILSVFTFLTFPMVETIHEHESWTFRIASANGCDMAVRTCGQAVSAMANNPLPLLIFKWGDDGCIGNGRTFSSHSYETMRGAHVDYGLKERVMAYALAVRLKELEDSGTINDAFVANAMSAQKVSWVGKALKWRNEKTLKVGESVLEIVEFESDADSDFAYRFVLSRKGRVLPSDYGKVREALRSAVRSQYSMKHPDVNPRSLVVDFVEYAMTNGRIEGKVAVLTLETESLAYDSVTRKGRIAVRVGVNQLEEARRWMRKNIGELAVRSNILIQGDKIPTETIFYVENETLRENRLLEMEFRTE